MSENTGETKHAKLPEDYVEEDEIAFTIQRWFPHLMTDYESQVRYVSILRAKNLTALLSIDSPHVREVSAKLDLERIERELAEGYMPFLRRVATRVMSESPDEVILNRCAKCQRVVGTPYAKWCKWCKFDWH